MAMRRIALAAAALVGGAAAGVAGASVILGPQGEFSTFIGRLEYDPSTACGKPVRPYSNDRAVQAEYIKRAKLYLQCLQDAAESDSKYANEVIEEGLKKQSDDFVDEVEKGA
jgi:hypothetical protein